jgi:hypothetical protein
MTESEWLNTFRYRTMYDHVRKLVTARRARLYMVACCRLKHAEFFDSRIEAALEAAERCADDPRAEAILLGFQEKLEAGRLPEEFRSLHTDLPDNGIVSQLARAVWGARQLRHENFARDAKCDIAWAVNLSLQLRPGTLVQFRVGDAAECCAAEIASAGFSLLSEPPLELFDGDPPDGDLPYAEIEISLAIANILRDIFGNPFRPVSVVPGLLAWKDRRLPRLAHAIYDAKAFDDMPILADALEEAGCSSAEILGHCRSGQSHVRVCWVVDLLLGKS